MGPSCPIVTMARVPGPCEWPQSSLPGLLSPWLLGPVVCLFLCEEEHFRWETTGLAAPWVWGFLPCFETLPATLQVHVCVPTILTLHAACPASLLSVCVYVVNSRSFNFIAVFGTWGCSALPPPPPRGTFGSLEKLETFEETARLLLSLGSPGPEAGGVGGILWVMVTDGGATHQRPEKGLEQSRESTRPGDQLLAQLRPLGHKPG